MLGRRKRGAGADTTGGIDAGTARTIDADSPADDFSDRIDDGASPGVAHSTRRTRASFAALGRVRFWSYIAASATASNSSSVRGAAGS